MAPQPLVAVEEESLAVLSLPGQKKRDTGAPPVEGQLQYNVCICARV